MKLKEVIEICLTYLGDEESSVSKQTAEHPKIKLLINCANIVIKEIMTDYLPTKLTEIIKVKGKSFEYDILPYRVREIIKITHVDSGQNVAFYQKPSTCDVEKDGLLKVEYTYLPFDATVEDECHISPKVSAKALALGVVSEYSLIEGMYEQSVMFGQKFQDEMRIACRPSRSINLKPRSWT